MTSRYRWNLHVVALALGVSVIASCAACQSSPTPPPPAPVLVDAQADTAGWDVYSQACFRLRALGRPEGEPDGGSCYAVMRHASEGHLVDLAPGCVADAGTVADLCHCSRSWATSPGCR